MKYLNRLMGRTGIERFGVEGYTFEVRPGVFPPATDTNLLARNIWPQQGDVTLDMSCGCGVNGIIAALRSETYSVAADINPHALENTQENAQKHSVVVYTYHSDMWSSVPVGQYPLIVANGPHHEGEIQLPIAFGCFGARNFNEELLTGARDFMDRRSRLLVVYPRFEGREDYFERLLRKNNLKGEIIDSCGNVRRKTKGRYILYQVKR